MISAEPSATPTAASSLFLLYHELRPSPAAYSYVTDTPAFREHLHLFTSALTAGSLQPRITFDDGHISNLSEALPALQEHGLSADFFITAGWTGTRPDFMNAGHLRELLSAGQRIGAHGFTHTLLTHCSPAELDRELRVARLTLEDILGSPVTAMSLPGGRQNRAVLEACWSAGYTRVFTSVPRPEPAPLHRCVGRLNIHGGATTAWLRNLLDPSSGLLQRLERTDRLKSVAKRLVGDRLYRTLWSVVNREERTASDAQERSA